MYPRTNTLPLPITLRPTILLKPIQLRTNLSLPLQNPAPNPPRQDLLKLIRRMRSSRHTKHIIQLLERSLLSLRQEKEDECTSHEIHRRVEAESALDAERLELSREGEGYDGGPEIVGRDGPGHAYFSVGQREDFSGVGERHGPFAGGVESVVDVDEECYHA